MSHKQEKALRRRKQKVKARNERQHSHRADRAKPLRKQGIDMPGKKPGEKVKAEILPGGKVVVTDNGEQLQFPSLRQAMDEFGPDLDLKMDRHEQQ